MLKVLITRGYAKELLDLLNDPKYINKNNDPNATVFGLPSLQQIQELEQVKLKIDDIQKVIKENQDIFTPDQAEIINLLAEKVKLLEERINSLESVEKNTKEATNDLSKKVEEASDNMNKGAKESDEYRIKNEALNSTFGSLAHRIESTVSALAIFNKSMQIVRNAVKSVEELDAAFTQIAIVSEQTGEQAWKLFDDFNKLAKQYSITTKDLTEGAKLFYQQGLNAADTMKMVEASTVSAALGEVTMTEAANTLTAAIQGYNESAAVAMDYTDKIAMVGAVSAADFNELSTAMKKTASSAYTAGIDFDHLLGYLGKMIEVTREAPENLGTAMKTIIARFEDMKKDPLAVLEDGVTANKVEEALATIGIALRDTAGEFRPLQDVFTELGMKWESLTRNQQAYIATIAAGSRQQSRFLALFNDFDRTLQLVTESQESAGAAAQQYATYQDSIAAAQARLTASWEELYSKIIDKDIIKFAINGLSELLELLSKIPPSITAIGVTIGALQLQNFLSKNDGLLGILRKIIDPEKTGIELGKAFITKYTETSASELIKQSPKITNGFKSLGKGIGNSLITMVNGLTAVTKAIGVFIAANWQIIVIGTIIAGVIASITYKLNEQKREYEDTIKKVKDYNEESTRLSQRSNEGETLINRYEELSNKISLTEEEQNELNNTIAEISTIYPDAIEYIDQYGNKHLANVEILREEIELEKELANESARASLQKQREVLQQPSKNWTKEGFSEIGLSNYWSDQFFNSRENEQYYQNLRQTDNTWNNVLRTILAGGVLQDLPSNSFKNDTKKLETYLKDLLDGTEKLSENDTKYAVKLINDVIDKFGLKINKLEQNAQTDQIRNTANEINKLYNNLDEYIQKAQEEQELARSQLLKKLNIQYTFSGLSYNTNDSGIRTSQKMIASQMQGILEGMDINIWNEFLNENGGTVENLLQNLQEIIDNISQEDLAQLFQNFNEGNIPIDNFITFFNQLATESGNEVAKNFAEAFSKQLEQQLNLEKDKYREYLNNLGIEQDVIEEALKKYTLGSGNRRQNDIENYFTESNGPMQSMIDQYVLIDEKALSKLDETVNEAVQNGNIRALEDFPDLWLKEYSLIDNEAAKILLSGKIAEAIQQLASSAIEEANKISDDLFSKQDYSSVKASELYQYKDVLGDDFYQSFRLGTNGNLDLTEEAQQKIVLNNRQKNIEALENEIFKQEALEDILKKTVEDSGDSTEELQKQIEELEEQIIYYKEILGLAEKIPALLQDSMDITEDLTLATQKYGESLEHYGHDISNNAKTLKISSDIGKEYADVLKITKDLDNQMEKVGHVSRETMDSLLEMGGMFADFFTITDDETILYGLQNVVTDYQSASEAILDIEQKRREAELELKRQEINDEIKLVDAKIEGYNGIADALEEYATFRRTEEANATEQEKSEAKKRLETQISTAQKSIEQAENVWNAQVAAAKMAYDQMADLDIAFWSHLNSADIKDYVAGVYGTFQSITAPEYGVINLNDLIANGTPEQLDEAAGKYRSAAKGLEEYRKSLEKAKENLKAIDPTLYDTMAEKLEAAGSAGKEAMEGIAKAAEEVAKALEDLDNLLIELERDLKDITVDYNPFTDLFEAWEHEWDYYYNIKRLIAEIQTQGEYIDNIISADYISADKRVEAYHAKIGNLIASMSANDTYITALRTGMAQTAVELMDEFGDYYKVDPSTGQLYQTDKNLTDINDTINQTKEEIYNLTKLQNEKENDLSLEEAKLDALEQEKSAYEDILSTIESQIDSLGNNDNITVDLGELESEKATLKANIEISQDSIDEQKQRVRDLEDEIQEIEVQITLKGNIESQLEDYVDRMEDKVSEYEEYWDTLNETIAEQQQLLQELSEIQTFYIDTAISTEQELYNAIVENYQNEINQKKKQYDYLKQLDNDYLASIKDNINKERQARDDANKQRSYQQNLQRAQLLQMDTSGAYRSELAQLNKEIESQRQDLYDDLVDKQVEALEKEIEKRHELYDMEVAALEERLAYMQENAILLWEMVNEIVAEGSESMMATLENTMDYINSNELSKQKQRTTWENNIKITFDGVVNNQIDNIKKMIASGSEYVNSLQEIKDAIGVNIDTYKMSTALLVEENESFQTAMNMFMAEWNRITTGFTGYYTSWEQTVSALKTALDANIEALIAMNNQGGSIKELDATLRNSAQEMYDDFIKERQRYRDELTGVINNISSQISAAIKSAADAIRNAAGSIQATPSNTGNGTNSSGSGGTGSGGTGSGGTGSGGEDKTWRIRYWVNGTAKYSAYGTRQELDDWYSRLNKGEDIAGIPLEDWKRRSGSEFVHYKQGGLADFTGPAWLDGTTSNPERVLSPKQTKLFESMVSSLEQVSNKSNINSPLGSSYNIGDINTSIQVAKLDDNTDIDKLAKKVEDKIVKTIRNRVVVSM